jgi:hypothetical protein
VTALPDAAALLNEWIGLAAVVAGDRTIFLRYSRLQAIDIIDLGFCESAPSGVRKANSRDS